MFAHDIAGLLDQLNIQEIVIGGLSMGGQIVMEFAHAKAFGAETTPLTLA
jgi:pimeloyl-ACP methyl ester carboxylesterase